MRPVLPVALALFAIALSCGGCGGGGGKCRGELADIGGNCPPTFDGDVATVPCGAYSFAVQSRACGDLLELRQAGLYVGGSCYYDSTTHALVGAAAGADIHTFCDMTSFAIYAGRTSSDCAEVPVASKDCPVDAGGPPQPKQRPMDAGGGRWR